MRRAGCRVLALCLAIILPLTHLGIACAVPPARPLRILFVGNSLTYYNDMPKMVASILDAYTNRVVDIEMVARGGATMREQLDAGTMKAELGRRHYDVVVLQDRGDYPLCSDNDAACADSVVSMCEAANLVRRVHARAIWFGTYQMLASIQAELSNVSARAASKCHMEFADVGAAMQAFKSRSDVPVWRVDGHPEIAGSWITASVLARAIVRHALSANLSLTAMCRSHWQDSDLLLEKPASEQPGRNMDCEMPSATLLHDAIAAAGG